MENEYIYTSSDGTKTPVSRMQNTHLVNTLVKKASELAVSKSVDAIENYDGEQQAVTALKAEVLKRMPIR